MSDEHRDPNGRFRNGHPGGPGSPRRTIELDYLTAISEAVPLPRWKRIIERAADDAEQGDSKAREWLSGYLAGKPTGDALLKLAAAELARADPVAIAAHDVAVDAMFNLFAQSTTGDNGDK